MATLDWVNIQSDGTVDIDTSNADSIGTWQIEVEGWYFNE